MSIDDTMGGRKRFGAVWNAQMAREEMAQNWLTLLSRAACSFNFLNIYPNTPFVC